MRNPFTLKNTIEDEGRAVNTDFSALAFEESLLDKASAQERLERGEEKRFRLVAALVLGGMVFGILGLRLYYLTIVQHQYFKEIAQGNRLRVEYLAAPRGAIHDRFGGVLAGNKPSFELVASPLDLPSDLRERQEVISQVSKILGVGNEEIEVQIRNDRVQAYESVLVKQNLSREQALIFNERATQLPGFRVMSSPIRDYKSPTVFAHLLGYVGKINSTEYEEKAAAGYHYNDSLGKTGIEQVYEKFLRGQFGERQIEVDARGTVKKVFGEKSPLPGNNLYLNIDAGLQEELFRALTTRLKTLNRRRAVAIAMSPKDGRVLALVSLPSFDNNLFAEGISVSAYQKLAEDDDQPLFNRGITGTYPPGSTVKPMVAAAGLEEGVISERTLIEDQGQIIIRNIYGGPDAYFYGYSRKALGVLDIRKAIALSSDVFFYILGGGYDLAKIKGLGIEKLAEYYRDFQIDKTLGIDLPGEKPGLVPTPEWKKQRFQGDPILSRWYLGNTYHVAIGQGDLLATPLQVLSWTATLANGGKIFRPFVVDRVEDNEGRITTRFTPQVIGEVGIDPNYLEIVREGMRQVVTEGTAKSLASLPIAVAGKTGTAQFDAKNLNRAHAWFAAFAPYENPEIAIVVLIEDGGEGGVNSVPVVREVLDWWARNRYLK